MQATGCQREPAAGHKPVFGRAAAAWAQRFVCLRSLLIHVDPRLCSHAAGAWAARDRGTVYPGLDPSLNSVSKSRGISKYSQHQGYLA